MSKQQSPNWSKVCGLPILEKGTHEEYETQEGFPKHTKGTFELVLLNGMHIEAKVSKPVSAKKELWWIAKREYLLYPQVMRVNGMISEVLVLGWKQV